MNVLGLDPGLKNFGWAVVVVTAVGPKLMDCGVIRTEKSDKKRAVLATEDNVRRAREIAQFLFKICQKYDVVAISAEAMSFPPSASASAKIAMTWGCIASVSAVRALPIIQASPQEIKRILCNRKDASKEAVAAEVVARLGESMPARLEATLPKSVHEHAYDAASTVLTALDTSEVLRALRKVSV